MVSHFLWDTIYGFSAEVLHFIFFYVNNFFLRMFYHPIDIWVNINARLGLSWEWKKKKKKPAENNREKKRIKICFGSYNIHSRVVCVLHFIYTFGLGDLECVFMAIGLGYRHQHRGNFVYRKFGEKKATHQQPTKKNNKVSYFCLCLSFIMVVFYHRRMHSLCCKMWNDWCEMIRYVRDLYCEYFLLRIFVFLL